MCLQIGALHELKSIHDCDDVCALLEVDADEASVRADVFEACSTRSSSIVTDLFAGSSVMNSELDFDDEEECSDMTGYVYESMNDEMDSLSVVSSISSSDSQVCNPTNTLQVGHDGIVVVDVVDLTNDDSVQANLLNEGLHQAEFPNELQLMKCLLLCCFGISPKSLIEMFLGCG